MQKAETPSAGVRFLPGFIIRLALNGALVLGSLLAVTVLAEFVLRASGRFPSQDVRTATREEYERIPGIFSPGQHKHILRKPRLPHTVTVNSLGLRGPEVPLHPLKRRILMLGDSFVFGDYVNDDQTLPAMLQQALADSYEVLNGGILGATIEDELYYLDRFLALKPGLVVLVYSENDLTDLYTEPPLHGIFARNRLIKSGPAGMVYRLCSDTCLFNLLQKFRIGLLVKAARRAQHEQTAALTAGTADAGMHPEDPKLPEYVGKLLALREKLDRAGIPLIFAAYPSHFNIIANYRHATIPPLLNALAAHGIHGIDLTVTLNVSGYPKDRLYLFPFDGHPSPLGYRLAAAELARAVLAAENGIGEASPLQSNGKPVL